MHTDETLKKLDDTLDTVDVLLSELPITKDAMNGLRRRIYKLWEDVEWCVENGA